MKPAHALILVVAVAIASVAGTYAALRTTQLSTAAALPSRVGTTAIARQDRALDRAQAALRAQLRRKPPALPLVPAPVARPSAVTAAAAPPVVYVRPKPIIHVVHRHGGGEHENDGGDSAAGAGLDD